MKENLGDTLRKTRESAGITVNDAVYRGRIPRSVVEALEAEDFGFFTSPLYARSFLRQYSEYIGADVEPWIEDLVPSTLIDGDSVESFIDISEPVATIVTKKQNTNSNGAWAPLWMLLISAGLIWGGFRIYDSYDQKLSTQPAEIVGEKEELPIPPTPPAAGEDEKSEPATDAGLQPPKRAIIVNLPEE